MSVSDDEFEQLFEAYSKNPESGALRAELVAAADRPLRRSVIKALGLTGDMPQADADRGDAPHEGAQVIDIVSRSRHRPAARDVAGLDQVGGLETVKAQLRRRLLDPLKHPNLFRRFKRRSGGGLLLYGPPGCGKTMIVRAAAAEADVRLICIEAAEILEYHVGVSEKKIRAAFDEARASRPCVLFFDEVEALAARRGQGSDFKAGLVSTFLGAFDTMEQRNDGVLVIAATNMPWAVDTAFRRPGRFDKTLFVPPPDRGARRKILSGLIEARPQSDSIDLAALADRTRGFSGADLVHLVETAIDLAIEDSIEAGRDLPIGPSHLAGAMAEIQPTTIEWLAVARNYAKYANEGGAYSEVLAFLDKHAA